LLRVSIDPRRGGEDGEVAYVEGEEEGEGGCPNRDSSSFTAAADSGELDRISRREREAGSVVAGSYCWPLQ
jgi:hypothetical protein